MFGFATFRGHQAAVIDHVLRGGDALVVMPTGGGKSLCYQLPALLRPGLAVVVSPLIALMEDQVRALRQLGVRAAFINSSLEPREQQRVAAAAEAGALDLLYVAPERLLTDGFLALLDRLRLALFAIDEAHCVSQWGHDFRPEYMQLGQLAARFPGVPRLALTATADAPTRREILDKLAFDGARSFVGGFDRPNIHYAMHPKDEPARQLLAELGRQPQGASGIVYCLSRRRTEQTAERLCAAGYAALPYHAGLPAEVRTDHQRRFVADEVPIIVATVAFGMGIDKPDVRFVIHLDPPKSLEAYYQETGRAGRDGLPARAVLFYGLGDVALLRRLIDDGGDAERARVEHRKLDALLGLCETTRCRRQVLLAAFGEIDAPPCGNCDTCLEPVDAWDGTEAAQMALSAVYRTGQRFGAAHLTDILRGVATEKVARFGHDRLPTFGVGAGLDARAWRSVWRQLVAAGLLAVDIDGHGSLRLGAEATAVLRGQQTVTLRRDALPAVRGRRERGASLAALVDAGAVVDEALFQALRAERTALARAQAVPPYVIFSDRTLLAIAASQPRDLAMLSELHGVGEVKLARYGPVFVGCVRRHLGLD